MTTEPNPSLIDAPIPIRTPRLLIRPKAPGDGAETAAAIRETWDDLHRWMWWAETPDEADPEKQEIRARQGLAKFILREEFALQGIELATGRQVIWCSLHEIDWKARHCETGYWVRKNAQGQGYATETTNALLRYAFGPLGMQRVGINYLEGNEASHRIIQKLGFAPEGVRKRHARLHDGRLFDRHCYARLDLAGLPPLDVKWGQP